LFLHAPGPLIAGCASEPHLVPTPVVFKDPRLAFAPALPKELRTTSVPVFFATTRAKSDDTDHYSNSDGGGVTFGVATVRLGGPSASWDELVASHQTSTVDTSAPVRSWRSKSSAARARPGARRQGTAAEVSDRYRDLRGV
jgi:esterase/lipase superfamily enzyme